MASKVITLLVSIFLIQSITANCIRPSAPIAISESGGAFIITSTGPIAPSGIAVATDLSLDGNLEVTGTLPFLSAVAFEGSYPTSGGAAVSYGCGDGTIAITQEIGNPCGSNAASNSGLSINAVGIGSCGCRRS